VVFVLWITTGCCEVGAVGAVGADGGGAVGGGGGGGGAGSGGGADALGSGAEGSVNVSVWARHAWEADAAATANTRTATSRPTIERRSTVLCAIVERTCCTIHPDNFWCKASR
jgi:hypothetical protein